MMNRVYLMEDIGRLHESFYGTGDYYNAKGVSTKTNTFIHHCLYHLINLNVKETDIVNDKFGKPHLLGIKNIHFNISHSCGAYVFVCSDQL